MGVHSCISHGTRHGVMEVNGFRTLKRIRFVTMMPFFINLCTRDHHHGVAEGSNTKLSEEYTELFVYRLAISVSNPHQFAEDGPERKFLKRGAAGHDEGALPVDRNMAHVHSTDINRSVDTAGFEICYQSASSRVIRTYHHAPKKDELLVPMANTWVQACRLPETRSLRASGMTTGPQF